MNLSAKLAALEAQEHKDAAASTNSVVEVAHLDLIMHLDRMPDGRRVVTSVTELQGMEGDTILLQDIFKFRMFPRQLGEDVTANTAKGELVATG